MHHYHRLGFYRESRRLLYIFKIRKKTFCKCFTIWNAPRTLLGDSSLRRPYHWHTVYNTHFIMRSTSSITFHTDSSSRTPYHGLCDRHSLIRQVLDYLLLLCRAFSLQPLLHALHLRVVPVNSIRGGLCEDGAWTRALLSLSVNHLALSLAPTLCGHYHPALL